MNVLESLLTRDSCVLQRPQGGSDEEGNPLTGFSTIGAVRGTWGTPTAREMDEVGRQGQTVTASFATGAQARVGDRLVGLRGYDWSIEYVQPLVTHMRYLLMRVR